MMTDPTHAVGGVSHVERVAPVRHVQAHPATVFQGGDVLKHGVHGLQYLAVDAAEFAQPDRVCEGQWRSMSQRNVCELKTLTKERKRERGVDTLAKRFSRFYGKYLLHTLEKRELADVFRTLTIVSPLIKETRRDTSY